MPEFPQYMPPLLRVDILVNIYSFFMSPLACLSLVMLLFRLSYAEFLPNHFFSALLKQSQAHDTSHTSHLLDSCRNEQICIKSSSNSSCNFFKTLRFFQESTSDKTASMKITDNNFIDDSQQKLTIHGLLTSEDKELEEVML